MSSPPSSDEERQKRRRENLRKQMQTALENRKVKSRMDRHFGLSRQEKEGALRGKWRPPSSGASWKPNVSLVGSQDDFDQAKSMPELPTVRRPGTTAQSRMSSRHRYHPAQYRPSTTHGFKGRTRAPDLPFGISLLTCAETPGPGRYDAKLPGRKADGGLDLRGGYMCAARPPSALDLHILQASEIPGPSEYGAPDLPRSNPQAFSTANPKSDTDWKCYQARQQPGPGAYEEYKPEIKGGVLSTARPFSDVDWAIARAREIPAPNAYDTRDKLQLNGGVISEGRSKSDVDWAIYRASSIPAPNAYGDLPKPRTPGGRFPEFKAKTWLERLILSKQDDPAPTAYASTKGALLPGGGVISNAKPKSDIEWTILRSRQVPGPGHYDTEAVMKAAAPPPAGGRFNTSKPKSYVEWLQYRAAQTPGPSDYGAPDAPRPNAQQFSTAKTKSDVSHVTCSWGGVRAGRSACGVVVVVVCGRRHQESGHDGTTVEHGVEITKGVFVVGAAACPVSPFVTPNLMSHSTGSRFLPRDFGFALWLVVVVVVVALILVRLLLFLLDHAGRLGRLRGIPDSGPWGKLQAAQDDGRRAAGRAVQHGQGEKRRRLEGVRSETDPGAWTVPELGHPPEEAAWWRGDQQRQAEEPRTFGACSYVLRSIAIWSSCILLLPSAPDPGTHSTSHTLTSHTLT